MRGIRKFINIYKFDIVHLLKNLISGFKSFMPHEA